MRPVPAAGRLRRSTALQIQMICATLSKTNDLLCREGMVSQSTSVKVSSRYQISVPRMARDRLHIKSGDRLLIDVQDGLLILVPQPQDYAAHLAGLHKEVWAGLDTVAYLEEERETWNEPQNGSRSG